ncbi:ATP-binding SpoIIE family protein phosphatase [Gloeothece verrucosa]|uniref:Putative anti-sigma regulatory factor, serine/threonine protein kinase n=1 Tax=Gloeothece verrucosa (strain PCC 7822) TaxID=497965 RepID=E0UGQ5_GLOV7|nr:SpoIIE family protein phosphatase [Gloeothece verrucosa]ADN13264.1 putative anti-sigma regulatory factor, serine/threonine protein kinase [Gloeothece verrucosa PCC 7822]
MNEAILLPISEPSQTGKARREALTLASRLGFDETKRGKVGLVVTEIANNLVLHATEGLLLLQAIERDNQIGIEILSLDQGPGMSNISECLRDGFSTAGTAGNGLGAISRLSDGFEVYSSPKGGTAILAQLWLTSASSSLSSLDSKLDQIYGNPITSNLDNKIKLEIGTICLAKAGQEVSGDIWATVQQDERILLLVADGLGHGLPAAQASLEARRIFHASAHLNPKEIIEATHLALRSTRGAALAIAEIDFSRQTLRWAGVGNIAGAVFFPQKSYSMVSHNGTVGHEMRKVQEFTYDWQPGGFLVMHSDGLGTQWNLDRYPGLTSKHSSLIAGVLYRDFNRGRDDVTVLVAREIY